MLKVLYYLGFSEKNVGMTVDIFCMYAKETTLISVLTFENCLESMASDYFLCLGLSDQKGGLPLPRYIFTFLSKQKVYLNKTKSINLSRMFVFLTL